jgi:hypothetical protein
MNTMPEQSILSQLLCGAAALLLVGGALWALRSTGRRVEQDTRTTLDREAAQLAADWLAQLMPCSREQALRALLTSDANSAEARCWRDANPRVQRVFERAGRGQYTMTLELEAANGDRVERRRALSLDELPDPVRAAIVRGEQAITIAWRPAFQEEV